LRAPDAGAARAPLADPARTRRRPPRERPRRALERLGGHEPRAGRLGRRVSDRRLTRRGTPARRLRRRRPAPRPGGAELVGRGAAAADRGLARVSQFVAGTRSPLTLSSTARPPTSR